MNNTNENKIVKGLLYFFKWIAMSFKDYFDSFKYNHSKIAGYLIAVPGILIGFCLEVHYQSSVDFITTDFDYSGLILFALVLLGVLNLFNAFNVMKKRNLGSCVSSTLITLLIIVFSVFWIKCFYDTKYLIESGTISLADGVTNFPFVGSVTDNTGAVKDVSYRFWSLFCMYVSMITSTIGCVFSFIFRDKNYKKERD